jgi:uncharacterized protein
MAYQYQDAVIMIFCKAPVPGQVKTRLLSDLSEKEAAELHIELSLRTVRTATESKLCPVQLWVFPSTQHSFFNEIQANYSLSLHKQHGLDLGEKMHNAFLSALQCYPRALLVGCDCPLLTASHLEQALSALSQPQSCVLVPAEDGGYVLVGLNKPQPQLFNNINWGTASVFKQTVAIATQLSLRLVELEKLWDLDTPVDLFRYRRLVLGELAFK